MRDRKAVVLAFLLFNAFALCANGAGGERKNRFDTVENRCRFVLSALSAHQNIISANQSFKRNLLDLLAHLPELLKRLGRHSGETDFSITARTVTATYQPSVTKYNEKTIEAFRKERTNDLDDLGLHLFGNLGEQISHIYESSHVDGKLDERLYENRLKKLYRLLPFLFDADGTRRFQDGRLDRDALNKRIQETTPSELQNGYGDLVPQHLASIIREHAKNTGQKRAWELFVPVRDNFMKREIVGRVLKPVNEEAVSEVRSLGIERLPHALSLLRGCYGGDCSINSVPFYGLLKEARTYFIRSGGDPDSTPIGYAISVLVDVGGKKVPYIITINGKELSKSDSEMVIRMVAKDYESDEVVVPDFRKRFGETTNTNWNLVNSDAPREAMMNHSGEKAVVTLPTAWEIVDKYIKEHNGQGYINYYDRSQLDEGYILKIPVDARSNMKSQEIPSRYQPVEDPKALPLKERAILAAQVLSDKEGHTYLKGEVTNFLSVTEKQADSVRPLLELTDDRLLTAHEYRELSKHVGYGLPDVLNFKPEMRTSVLKRLYEEDASLFAEHRQNPKGNGRYLEAMSLAYGRTEKAAQLVRSILSAKDISNEDALALLKRLDSAFHWDTSALKDVLARARGKSIEQELHNQAVTGLWEFAYAQTRTEQRLLELLENPDTRELAKVALDRVPKGHRMATLATALREVRKISSQGSIPIPDALRQWFSDPGVSAEKKATLLRPYLNAPNFEDLLSTIPDEQKSAVEDGVSHYSNIGLFRPLLSTSDNKTAGRSWFERSKPIPVAENVLSGTTLEAFEFADIQIPEGGVTVRLGEPGNAQREVTLTKGYQIGTTQLTQLQYAALMGTNPSQFKDGKGSIEAVVGGKKISMRPNRPVETVSWTDEEPGIKRLNELDPRFSYRRPTEAEWEYATRGGTDTKFSFGSSSADLPLYGWFDGNSDQDGHKQTHDVAGLRPNPNGIYDAHGNVWEWVQDCYESNPAGGIDPQGPEADSARVFRGGGWGNDASTLRSADRDSRDPGYRHAALGFRLLRTPK